MPYGATLGTGERGLGLLLLCVWVSACASPSAVGTSPRVLVEPASPGASATVLDDPVPSRPPPRGIVPREGSIACQVDAAAAPATIPPDEQVAGLAVQRLDKSTLMVICAGDRACCMPDFGGAGGAYAGYVMLPATSQVGPMCILRMVGEAPDERVEVRVVWVDAVTLGTRVALAREVELTPVGGPAELTQVYALTAGDAPLALVPTRGQTWVYATPPDTQPEAATGCNFMTFPLASADGDAAPPVIMAGPLSTPDHAWTGPQVWLEITASERHGETRVSAAARPWQSPPPGE